MEEKLVSVIVPVYKIEKYIEKCVRSILAQSYTNLEIILVDDGSPDGCPGLCDKLAGLDARVKVIHKKNGGLSDARNAGLGEADGKYIVFIDGDDYIEKNMIETLVCIVEQNSADLGICNINNVTEDGTVLEDWNSGSPIRDGVFVPDEIFNEFLNPSYWFFVTAWNKLYKRELFDRLRFKVGKIHEDEFMAHYMIAQCEKIACTTQRLYNYVQRKGSITGSGFSIKKLDGVEAMLDRADFFVKTERKHLLKHCYATIIKYLTIAFLKKDSSDMKKRASTLWREAKSVYLRNHGSMNLSKREKLKYGLFFHCRTLYLLKKSLRGEEW